MQLPSQAIDILYCIALYRLGCVFFFWFSLLDLLELPEMETRGQHIATQIKPSPTIHYNLLHGSSGWSGLPGQDDTGQDLNMYSRYANRCTCIRTQGDAVVSSFIKRYMYFHGYEMQPPSNSLYSGSNTFNSIHIIMCMHTHTHTHSECHISHHMLMTKALQCRCNLKHNTSRMCTLHALQVHIHDYEAQMSNS